MFVTRRRLNTAIAAYQSEVKHYSDSLEKVRIERDLYKRELEAIRSRIQQVVPEVKVQCHTTA